VSLPSFAFSTQEVGPEFAFEAYRDLYAGGADVARIGPDFYAQVQAYRLDRMILFKRRLNGLQHSRSPQRVRQDGFDHITLHLLLEGELLAGPPGHERRVRPGEILVCDNTLPHLSRAHRVRQISTPVARELIEPLVPDLRTFHGAILPECVGGLVADFIVSLTRRSETLDSAVVSRSSAVLGMLLAAALRGHAAPTEAIVWAAVHDGPDDTGRRRREAEAHVERHLANRALSAETIAAELGISRSLLYRAFLRDGGVARFVQQRRLERARDALRRQGETRSIATLAYAYGFASEQHFNRAFRTAFGRPPGQFRTSIQQLRSDVHARGDRSWPLAAWHSELY
jgi:AraC-like DNA-binding protein